MSTSNIPTSRRIVRLRLLLPLLVLAGIGSLVAFSFRGSDSIPVPEAMILKPEGPTDRSLSLLSKPYRLDRIYRSMEGPWSPHAGLKFPAAPGTRMVWLTGLDTEVVDAYSIERTSPEFLCHSNLTFDQSGGNPQKYNRLFNNQTHLDWRLFTIVPGRMSIHLPEGFGIPVPADAPLDYLTMSLNLNVHDRVVDVRVKSRVHAVPENDPAAPTKALFRKALYTLQPQDKRVSDNPATMMKGPATHVGMGCGDMCSVNMSAVSTVGSIGEGKTLHWLVPPGNHVYRTEITPQLGLPFDTTVHYATFHVHPFGKSMQLRDLTTGEVLLNLISRDWPDRLGVAHVDEVKSIEGIPLYQSHRYEVVVEYENTTDRETDAMGILYLYLLEKTFSLAANR